MKIYMMRARVSPGRPRAGPRPAEGGQDLKGQGQGWQNWLRAGLDRPVDSLFGHDGNASSLQKVANWAGVGKGTVTLATRRVMTAVLHPDFMQATVHFPSQEEKEAAKCWVHRHSFRAWRNGWCFFDGTLIPLATQPVWFGESFWDRKDRYSLNIQVL